MVQYPLFELGGFDYGEQKDLRRLHQPRQRGVLHEVQTAQKRVQGSVRGQLSRSSQAAADQKNIKKLFTPIV